MPGIIIRCPLCSEMGIELSLADNEHYLGVLFLGKTTRISMVCLECHTEFILTTHLAKLTPI